MFGLKNEKIAKVLKDTRKQNNLSVREVASELENHSLHVAEKTIYGWESGQSQPDADTLLVLCDIYDINDILGTFGYKETEPFHITQHEKELIMQYRKHPEMHEAIERLLK
ncbi:MAG: helix-turn-helix domain-containing protein [Lachnospiraceae bacterium]